MAHENAICSKTVDQQTSPSIRAGPRPTGVSEPDTGPTEALETALPVSPVLLWTHELNRKHPGALRLFLQLLLAAPGVLLKQTEVRC